MSRVETAPDAGGREEGRDKLAFHFATLAQQAHAAKLGMWVFLATEVLLFGGLFAAYAYYRVFYDATFRDASRELNLTIGTVNTFVLIASSFAVACASFFTRRDRRGAASLALAVAVVCGFVFLGLKAIEWAEHFRDGTLPGPYYHGGLAEPGTSLFFTFYFLMTGLHALHVTIGVAVLLWVGVLGLSGAFGHAYDTPLELSTLYWHFVDIVWIFLYPLLYLL